MSSELRRASARRSSAPGCPWHAAVDALEEAFRTRRPAGAPLRTARRDARRHAPADAGLRGGGDGREARLAHPRESRVGGCRSSTRATCCSMPRPRLPRRCSTARRSPRSERRRSRGLATRAARSGGRAVASCIFGAGVQATSAPRGDVRRASGDRPRGRVAGRAGGRGARARRDSAGGLTARLGEPEAVREADLVCTCTTAEEPAVRRLVAGAGAHVNAVGSLPARDPRGRLGDRAARPGRRRDEGGSPGRGR